MINHICFDSRPDLIVMGAERKGSKLGDSFSSTTTGVMQIAVGPLLLVPKTVQSVLPRRSGEEKRS
jgi:nucleotide-binding universal stress UspA family protein